MCGLFGIFSRNSIRKELAIESLNTLSHRGPDNEGYYSKENIFIGHRRLSILDLSVNGSQPMYDKEKNIIISVNGEIYNYKELKSALITKYDFKSNSDSEVILYGYKEWGIDLLLSKIDGMFAFSIYDKIKNKLFLVRDRAGIKPLYYSFINGEYTYASELKAIIKYYQGNLNLQFDNTAIYDFLTYLYIPSPKSLYKNIFKLEPAHYVEFDVSEYKYKKKQYWQIEYKINNNISFDETLEELISLLKKSIKDQMISDVPVGFFLSGGIDSSTVVALASEFSESLNTYSIGFENDSRDETKYAEIVSSKFGTNHEKKVVKLSEVMQLKENIKTWYDEPFGDTSCFPSYIVSKLAKHSSTVVLTGDGGDELFGGYKWYKSFGKYRNYGLSSLLTLNSKEYKSSFFNKINSRIEKYFLGDLQLYSKLLSGESAKLKSNYKKLLNIPHDYDDYWFFRKYYINELPLPTRLQYLDFHTYLPEDILTKVDRVSMAVSLECRVPFLSKELIEFSFSIPNRYVYHNNQLKGLLKESLSTILPHEILNREKQGFSIPLRKWNKDFTSNMGKHNELIKLFGINDYIK